MIVRPLREYETLVALGWPPDIDLDDRDINSSRDLERDTFPELYLVLGEC